MKTKKAENHSHVIFGQTHKLAPDTKVHSGGDLYPIQRVKSPCYDSFQDTHLQSSRHIKRQLGVIEDRNCLELYLALVNH